MDEVYNDGAHLIGDLLPRTGYLINVTDSGGNPLQTVSVTSGSVVLDIRRGSPDSDAYPRRSAGYDAAGFTHDVTRSIGLAGKYSDR